LDAARRAEMGDEASALNTKVNALTGGLQASITKLTKLQSDFEKSWALALSGWSLSQRCCKSVPNNRDHTRAKRQRPASVSNAVRT